jgi:hypothetical protein
VAAHIVRFVVSAISGRGRMGPRTPRGSPRSRMWSSWSASLGLRHIRSAYAGKADRACQGQGHLRLMCTSVRTARRSAHPRGLSGRLSTAALAQCAGRQRAYFLRGWAPCSGLRCGLLPSLDALARIRNITDVSIEGAPRLLWRRSHEAKNRHLYSVSVRYRVDSTVERPLSST